MPDDFDIMATAAITPHWLLTLVNAAGATFTWWLVG
jgi:hypothetical protein